MKEAALLDYYVCGFCWAKEANFTPRQTSFTMAVLHMLLDNIRGEEDIDTPALHCPALYSFSNALQLLVLNFQQFLFPPSTIIKNFIIEVMQFGFKTYKLVVFITLQTVFMHSGKIDGEVSNNQFVLTKLNQMRAQPHQWFCKPIHYVYL